MGEVEKDVKSSGGRGGGENVGRGGKENYKEETEDDTAVTKKKK